MKRDGRGRRGREVKARVTYPGPHLLVLRKEQSHFTDLDTNILQRSAKCPCRLGDCG